MAANCNAQWGDRHGEHLLQNLGARCCARGGLSLSQANKLGVTGYAHNLRDGSVEVLAAGDEQKVDELIAWLKAGGPTSARVDKVLVEPHQPTPIPTRFTTG